MTQYSSIQRHLSRFSAITVHGPSLCNARAHLTFSFLSFCDATDVKSTMTLNYSLPYNPLVSSARVFNAKLFIYDASHLTLPPLWRFEINELLLAWLVLSFLASLCTVATTRIIPSHDARLGLAPSSFFTTSLIYFPYRRPHSPSPSPS